MKLELKHLAPYLPYKIEVQYLDCLQDDKKIKAFLTGLSSEDGLETTYKRKRKGVSGDLMPWKGHNNIHDLKFQPLLRPLSDLAKTCDGATGRNYLEVLEEDFYSEPVFDGQNLCLSFGSDGIIAINVLAEPLEAIEFLFKHHFDVFGLIENGLAIDLNTLEQ